MSRKKKLIEQDKSDWEDFIKNPNFLFDKDELNKDNKDNIKNYKYDLHGYTIEGANKKISKIISECYKKSINEILIITGKGSHSKKKDNIYNSKDSYKLKNTIPEFINNNSEILKKIKYIKIAPRELGGEGAIIVKMKKFIK